MRASNLCNMRTSIQNICDSDRDRAYDFKRTIQTLKVQPTTFTAHSHGVTFGVRTFTHINTLTHLALRHRTFEYVLGQRAFNLLPLLSLHRAPGIRTPPGRVRSSPGRVLVCTFGLPVHFVGDFFHVPGHLFFLPVDAQLLKTLARVLKRLACCPSMFVFST
jgi:hypothetical protein